MQAQSPVINTLQTQPPLTPSQQPAVLKAFTGYGIELEYMIVDRDTLSVLPIADELFAKVAGSYVSDIDRTRFGWSNELVMHLVEIKNVKPESTLEFLASGFRVEIMHIDGLLSKLGARLMPTAMHPWMNPATETKIWPHQNAAIYSTYDRIFNCNSHGWANLQSMHLNLPFADDKEFERLHAAIRLLLPILPALAASSPIVEEKVSHMMDARMEAYWLHPRRIPSVIGPMIPDNSSSRHDYEQQVLTPIYQEMAPYDPEGVLKHEWINARAAIPRFDRNAIEIRVLDTQECPEIDIAIATLVSITVQEIFNNRWTSLAHQQALNTNALRDILLACIRDADQAIISNPSYLAALGYPGNLCKAQELWSHLLEATGSATGSHSMMTPASLAHLQRILKQGPLARRILNSLEGCINHGRIQDVYRELCECLVQGRMFSGSNG